MEFYRSGGPCLLRWQRVLNVQARRLSRLTGSILLVAVLCGCSDGQSQAGRQTSVLPKDEMPPVILVPGAEGSTLVTKDGRPMWNADLWSFFNAELVTKLAPPLPGAGAAAVKAKLVPHDLVRGLLWQDYYGGLIHSLERRVGAPCVLPGAIGADTRCVLFPWDWRGDMSAAAARLDTLIDRLREARREPGLRVDLVAHSAGGLVVRYFIRFGVRDVLDLPPGEVHPSFVGAGKVRRVTLIATPNNGTELGLRLMMRGHRLGFVQMLPEVIATMPGAYQLLPSPGRTWVLDVHGRPLARDLYKPATWQRLQESIYDPDVVKRVEAAPRGKGRLTRLRRFLARSLERGRRFQLALGQPVRQPFPYAVVGGDCQPTPTAYVEEQVRGRPRLRFFPDDIRRPDPEVDYEALMSEPGDGWITRRSVLGEEVGPSPFRTIESDFACGWHSTLASDPFVRSSLLTQLASADAAEGHKLARAGISGATMQQ